MAAQIDAYGLLSEEFKSDDVTEQLAAARRIPIIASCMGPDRCRSQLVPFLKTAVGEYTDEILHAIAKACGQIVGSCGGGDNAAVLLPLLETLCEHEETVVRSNAVDALVIVGKAMSGPAIQEHFAPMVKRLSSADFFPSKISGAGLYATVYPSTPHPQRPALRKQFELLTKDEMPMVRRAAFAHLPAFAASVEKEIFIAELSPIFNELSSDLQESVRELAVENSVAMVKGLTPDEATKLFGTFIDNVQNETSRSMRIHKAKHFVALTHAMHPTRQMRDQVQAFLRLIAIDAELEVRTEVAKNISTFCSHLEAQTLLGSILPVLRELSQMPQAPADQEAFAINQAVRESISEQAASLAPTLGAESTLSELLPLLQVFLGDELVEIRRKTLGSLAPVIETLGAEATEKHLLPNVLQMARDPIWRVRLAVVETLPVYAKHLGLDLFDAKMKEIQIAALQDNTARIREAAIANLPLLQQRFGDQWVQDAMLPVVKTAARGQGPMMHLQRIMSVQAVGALSSAVQGPSLEALVDEVVVPLARDKVAVVRIAASASLQMIVKANDTNYTRDTLRPLLVELTSDTDADVKTLAEMAIAG
uniref:TOG domain-containing protein n=1 Tax=Hemiselmis andersenii TaxID=464988 RepID=A0A6U5B6B9_HEMAN|mmetsp:Transcript_51388/g.124558  ORF Transcript_51388/g.124558 Transcript_51388/m.124558 type:complete len:593 (+) Transcript_51388:48-1826(+)